MRIEKSRRLVSLLPAILFGIFVGWTSFMPPWICVEPKPGLKTVASQRRSGGWHSVWSWPDPLLHNCPGPSVDWGRLVAAWCAGGAVAGSAWLILFAWTPRSVSSRTGCEPGRQEQLPPSGPPKFLEEMPEEPEWAAPEPGWEIGSSGPPESEDGPGR